MTAPRLLFLTKPIILIFALMAISYRVVFGYASDDSGIIEFTLPPNGVSGDRWGDPSGPKTYAGLVDDSLDSIREVLDGAQLKSPGSATQQAQIEEQLLKATKEAVDSMISDALYLGVHCLRNPQESCVAGAEIESKIYGARILLSKMTERFPQLEARLAVMADATTQCLRKRNGFWLSQSPPKAGRKRPPRGAFSSLILDFGGFKDYVTEAGWLIKMIAATFKDDVTECRKCGGRMEPIAVIKDPAVALQILTAMHLLTPNLPSFGNRGPPEDLDPSIHLVEDQRPEDW